MRNRGMSVLAVCVCVMAVCVGMAAARGKSFKNSGFEHGNFKGWQTKQEGDTGMWVVYKGTPLLSSFFPNLTPPRGTNPFDPNLRKPRRGKYAAATVQSSPGTQLLFKNITIKPNAKSKLAFVLSDDNEGPDWFNPTPNSLHATSTAQPPVRPFGKGKRGIVGPTPNQQFRVDIVRKGSDPYSIDKADVVKKLISTQTGDPLHSGWKRRRFNLSSIDPGKYRLRVAVVADLAPVVVGFDALKLQSTPTK